MERSQLRTHSGPPILIVSAAAATSEQPANIRASGYRQQRLCRNESCGVRERFALIAISVHDCERNGARKKDAPALCAHWLGATVATRLVSANGRAAGKELPACRCDVLDQRALARHCFPSSSQRALIGYHFRSHEQNTAAES